MPVRSYSILNTAVTFSPMKLSRNLAGNNFMVRLQTFLMNTGGFSADDLTNPSLSGLVNIYECMFFSAEHMPDNEPSGFDNLVECLQSCIAEDIDWREFILRELRYKSKAERTTAYNEIRARGMQMYKDFLIDLRKTTISKSTFIN